MYCPGRSIQAGLFRLVVEARRQNKHGEGCLVGAQRREIGTSVLSTRVLGSYYNNKVKDKTELFRRKSVGAVGSAWWRVLE